MPPKQSTDAVSSLSDKKLSARGEVARAKLKRAAMTVMEQTGYHGMRIHDVTTEAGVAAGLFYHYFKDLKSLTLEAVTTLQKPEMLMSLKKASLAVIGTPGCMRILASSLIVMLNGQV